MWTENDVLKAIETGRLQKNNIQSKPGASRENLANTESRLGLNLPSELKMARRGYRGYISTFNICFKLHPKLTTKLTSLVRTFFCKHSPVSL